jgi:hypothetical protein
VEFAPQHTGDLIVPSGLDFKSMSAIRKFKVEEDISLL